MSGYRDDHLAARFAALAPEAPTTDWVGVQRIARTGRRNRVVAYALVASLAVFLVGCAAALGPRLVRFADSEPSPPAAMAWLDLVRSDSERTGGGTPYFDPRLTRRLTTNRLGVGELSIDLTPVSATGGGFCMTVDYHAPARRARRSTQCIAPSGSGSIGFTDPIDTTRAEGVTQGHDGGFGTVVGWTTVPDANRIELLFEDGARSVVTSVWRVGDPIDAVFFRADVPVGRRSSPRRFLAVRVLNQHGRQIAKRATERLDAHPWAPTRFSSWTDEHLHGFPPAADTSREQMLVFPNTRARLWIAPAVGGRRCFIFHETMMNSAGADACLRDESTRRAFTLDGDSFWGQGVGVARPILYWGLVPRDVHRVVLRFRDGTVATVIPQEGFAVYAVPKSHYAPARRLVAAVLLGSDGRVVRRIAVDPTTPNIYPCDNPRDSGAGPVCP